MSLSDVNNESAGADAQTALFEDVPTRLDASSTALVVLSLIALIVFLHWARAVFIPITFAVLLSYAFTPVVAWLQRNAKLPKVLGAAFVLLTACLGLGLVGTSLQPEALNIIDLVPRATQKLTSDLNASRYTPAGAVTRLKKAVSEIENASRLAGTPEPTATAKSTPNAPGFRIGDYVLMGTVGLAAQLGQLVVVVALAYFLLIAGDTFRRTLVRVSGSTLTNKKITVQMLDEINAQIQRYLLVQIATSGLVGILAWAALSWIGLENAIMWGCIAAVLHLIPYAGPAVFVGLVGLVSYVQFDTFQPIALVIGSMVACNALIGLFLVPWLTEKVGSLNAVTVFISLLAWWLWGIWGLLLGVPLMMAFKAVCDRIEDLQPVSAFLGTRTKAG